MRNFFYLNIFSNKESLRNNIKKAKGKTKSVKILKIHKSKTKITINYKEKIKI